MRPTRWFVLLAALLTISACELLDGEATARRMRESDAFARDFILDLHQQGFPAVRERIGPSALRHFTGTELRDLRGALPARIDSIEIKRPVEFRFEDGYVTETLPLRIAGSGEALRVTVAMTERQGVRRVDTIRWGGE